MSDFTAPWERQPGEPTKAFAAFSLYRGLGPLKRSMRLVAEELGSETGGKRGGVPGYMERWASDWKWVERARAWDDEMDRQGRLAAAEEIKEMHRRHARAAMLMQGIGLKRLQKVTDANVEEKVSVEEARKLIDTGIRSERGARGEPETVSETRVDAVVTEVEADDRRAKLAERLARFATGTATGGDQQPDG